MASEVVGRCSSALCFLRILLSLGVSLCALNFLLLRTLCLMRV